jgi:ABC-type multidrug transport system ATPase subunit
VNDRLLCILISRNFTENKKESQVMQEKKAITVSRLRRSSAMTTAVYYVSFEVAEGVLGFLGPNGPGKTTLIRC